MSSIKPEDWKNPEGNANRAIYKIQQWAFPLVQLIAILAVETVFKVPELIYSQIDDSFGEGFKILGAGAGTAITGLVGLATLIGVWSIVDRSMDDHASNGEIARGKRKNRRR